VQNALDSPAPLRDVAGRLRWWARDGAGRAWGAAGWLTPVEAGPGARLPVATRPRRHRDRGAHGKPGRWPQRHPRRRCRARERPDPVTRDRASGHRHPQCPVRTCCGHRSTGTVARIRTYPASRRAGGWPSWPGRARAFRRAPPLPARAAREARAVARARGGHAHRREHRRERAARRRHARRPRTTAPVDCRPGDMMGQVGQGGRTPSRCAPAKRGAAPFRVESGTV